MKGKYLNFDHHTALKMGSHIAEISKVLLPFDISFFNHVRVYEDLSRLSLSNRPDWLEHFSERKYYRIYNEKRGRFSNIQDHIQNGKSLWIHLLDIVSEDAQKNFDIGNGITIIKKENSFIDFFLFASTPNNLSINSFYLENLDILEHFILFYKEKSEPIIKQIVPDVFVPDPETKSNSISQKENTVGYQKEREVFLETTKIKRYFIFEKENQYLTNQEFKCIKLLLLGKSQKNSANLMGVSYRTFNSYLENAKLRLNFYSTDSLVNFVGKKIRSSKSILL